MMVRDNFNASCPAPVRQDGNEAVHFAVQLEFLGDFAADPAAPRPPLDRAYADAMTALAAQHPGEPNVQTLYVDAVMNTMPWDYWQKDGAPKPPTARLMRTLERVIAANPTHAGAHHYYIHLIEASPTRISL